MSGGIAFTVFAGILALVCLATQSLAMRSATRDAKEICKLVGELNPYAEMLGREVEAKKYDGSDWERYVVVAVSWHGSLCLRETGDPKRKGFWVHHDRAMTHVREVADG